jgi:hypothetical protein
VSEKKSKTYDVAKIHEFIDGITPPPKGSTVSYAETKQKLLQKKLFDEPTLASHPASREGLTDNLPTWETVGAEPKGTETKDDDKNVEVGLPEFEPIPWDQIPNPADDDWLSSYDLLEIEVTWETDQGRQEKDQRDAALMTFEEVPSFEPTPVLERQTGIQTHERQHHARQNERRRQQQLRKDLKLKVKRERQRYLKQEKEARRLKRLEDRERKEGITPIAPTEKHE